MKPLPELLREKSPQLHRRYINIKEIADSGFQKYATQVGYLTDHGPQHYQNLETNLAFLLSDEVKDRLAVEEIFLLLCAVHFHDVGLLSEKYPNEPWTDVRKDHVNRTYDYLHDFYKDWGLNRFEAAALKNICLGHSGDTLYELPEEDVIHHARIRVRFLTALLRIADELDLDYTRISPIIPNLKKIPEESLKHWIKHDEIGGVLIDSKSWTIEVHAMPTNEANKAIIKSLAEQKLQRELEYVRPVFEKYGLYYRQVIVKYKVFGNKRSASDQSKQSKQDVHSSDEALLANQDTLTPAANITTTPATSIDPFASIKTIPDPPEPYIAHRYGQKEEFLGRTSELRELNDWAASANAMLIIWAMGGVGKSALGWEWFNKHASDAIPNLAGRLWWNFDESGATVDDFVRHALAYVTRQPLAAFNDMEVAVGEIILRREDRKKQLLDKLDQEPYLLVLDGLERLLRAYHRQDAPQLTRDQVEWKDKAEWSCTSPKDGEFLRGLIDCKRSKVLISTRHIPYDLRDRHTHKLIPGIRSLKLEGLEPNDAIALMLHLGVTGNENDMKRLMKQFDNHTLLLRVLAGTIINDHDAASNFDTWYSNKKDTLRLTELDLSIKDRHILHFALEGLDPALRLFLSRISAFHYYPIELEALKKLSPYLPPKQTPAAMYTASKKLTQALNELENRGLLHWDREGNLYDLHPVVRGYVLEGLKGRKRKHTFDLIRDYFQDLLPFENLNEVQELGQLRSSLEFYYALLDAGRLEEAASFYGKRLSDVLKDNLVAYYTMLELLRLLFPSQLDRLATLQLPQEQGNRVADLAYAYYALGQNKQALPLYEYKLKQDVQSKRSSDLCTTLHSYARSLRDDYQIKASLHAREVARDLAAAMNHTDNLAISYYHLLGIYRETGQWQEALDAYQRFIEKPPEDRTKFYQAHVERYWGQVLIYRKQDATKVMEDALKLAVESRNKLAEKQIYRWQGEAALQRGQLEEAAKRFELAIALTRASGDPSLAACLGSLARIRVLQREHKAARQLIEEAFKEKPILDEFDLLNSAASVYLELGDDEMAKEYAQEAHKQAWADGPPNHSFWWDLERAKSVLRKLGVSEQDMRKPENRPAFDGSIPYEAEIQRLIAELSSSK